MPFRADITLSPCQVTRATSAKFLDRTWSYCGSGFWQYDWLAGLCRRHALWNASPKLKAIVRACGTVVRACPLQQGIEQARGNAAVAPAITCVHKHFAERTVLVAEVEQRHRSHGLALGQSDPEVTGAVLVESRDVEEVGLILQRDRDVELVPLDAEDERAHAVSVL